MARVIPKLGKFVRFGDVLLAKMLGGSLDRDNCIRVLPEHNEAVQRFVPPEPPLVFRVTEGWERLCQFLGCAVPEGIPFLRFADSSSFAFGLYTRSPRSPFLTDKAGSC